MRSPLPLLAEAATVINATIASQAQSPGDAAWAGEITVTGAQNGPNATVDALAPETDTRQQALRLARALKLRNPAMSDGDASQQAQAQAAASGYDGGHTAMVAQALARCDDAVSEQVLEGLTAFVSDELAEDKTIIY